MENNRGTKMTKADIEIANKHLSELYVHKGDTFMIMARAEAKGLTEGVARGQKIIDNIDENIEIWDKFVALSQED